MANYEYFYSDCGLRFSVLVLADVTGVGKVSGMWQAFSVLLIEQHLHLHGGTFIQVIFFVWHCLIKVDLAIYQNFSTPIHTRALSSHAGSAHHCPIDLV